MCDNIDMLAGRKGTSRDATVSSVNYDSDEYVSNENDLLYNRRIRLWRLSSNTNSIHILYGALLGMKTRKDIKRTHYKAQLLADAKARVISRRAQYKAMIHQLSDVTDRCSQLQYDNSELRKGLTNEELLHQRQIHHLRNKLISDD